MLLKDGDKTMEISDALLRRRWGLPANATEAEIKVAIISRPPLPVGAGTVRAGTARVPGRPLLDAAARVQAASNESCDGLPDQEDGDDRSRSEGRRSGGRRAGVRGVERPPTPRQGH
jgi:hypothetical protein